MGYRENKGLTHHREETIEDYNRSYQILADQLNWYMDELDKAGRQIDKLDRKLAIRSRKLGDARESAREGWATADTYAGDAVFFVEVEPGHYRAVVDGQG